MQDTCLLVVSLFHLIVRHFPLDVILFFFNLNLNPYPHFFPNHFLNAFSVDREETNLDKLDTILTRIDI